MSPTAATTRSASSNTGDRDYGYANARIRGMRAKLLRSEAFERLMQADDMHTLIQALLETQYGPDLEESLLMGRNAASVFVALRHNLVRTYEKVYGFLNEEAKDICTTLLGRRDVANLKAILRGKHIGLSADEIGDALLPIGQLRGADLTGLAMQADIRGVIDTATTWGLPQAPAMQHGYGEYQKTGELADLEVALDGYYAAWAAKRLGRRGSNYAMGRRILGIQVDILNLIMVFRAARENLTPEQSEEYFLLGGQDVDLETFTRLAALSDVDEILDGLRATHFGKLVDDAALHYVETMSISTFERALEDYFTRKVIALGSTDPLGVGIPISYIYAKQNEVTNVRIITKGTEIGIPADRMRRELILV